MAKQRIEYIDAMRGLTMILVVYSHICRYCLGDWTMGGNDVLFLLRLPCFFFISGWLFYKAEGYWNREVIGRTVVKKLRVQILPTLIFLFLLAGPQLFASRLGATKGGYWFTFALFEFFCLYMLSVVLYKRRRHCDSLILAMALVISATAFAYDIYYNRYFKDLGWPTKALGFLGFMTWRYYLFFVVGTLVRKHFDRFECWLNEHKSVGWGVLVVFIVMSLLPQGQHFGMAYLRFALGGVAGAILLFIGFRRFSCLFCNERILGCSMQYIGQRTLDIYLLHYFFLPRFLLPYGATLQALNCLPLEIGAALVLALLIVAVCLAVSRVICLSPTLGGILFGKSH